MERIEDCFSCFLKHFISHYLHFLSTASVSQNFEMQLHCLFQKNFTVSTDTNVLRLMLCLQPTDILNRFSLFGSLQGINNYHNIVGLMVECLY